MMVLKIVMENNTTMKPLNQNNMKQEEKIRNKIKRRVCQ